MKLTTDLSSNSFGVELDSKKKKKCLIVECGQGDHT